MLFEEIKRSNPGYKSITIGLGGGVGNLAIDLEE